MDCHVTAKPVDLAEKMSCRVKQIEYGTVLYIHLPLARVAIVVWKNPMNQIFTKSTVRAICQLYILKLFRPRSNGENNLSYWVEGSPSLSSQLKQTFIWEKKVTPLPLQRRKMSAKSSFMCIFQEKEEKMRLMSLRPPMQHFFQSSGIFTILSFFSCSWLWDSFSAMFALWLNGCNFRLIRL